MTRNSQIKLQSHWDIDLVPAGRSSRRGLLIEVTPTQSLQDEAQPQRALGLALVLDRSGSMANGRLQAAIEAALGIIESMSAADRLSLVSFDDNTTIHFANRAMDDRGRRRASLAAQSLRPGGCTNLAGGWLEGARCVGQLQDQSGFDDVHVLMLSDGQANRGLTEPEELARHAAELASRGVFTSAAGVGNNYSPLQLGAIAEGGGGSLHDADQPGEIVDVLMGELGDLRKLVARDARLELVFPPELNFRALVRAGQESRAGVVCVELGNLYAGRTRPLPFLLDLPAAELHRCWTGQLRLSWTCAESGRRHERTVETSPLRAVEPTEADSAARNQQVASAVSRLWQADLSYLAMQHNERGDFARAQASLVSVAGDFSDFVSDLDDAPVMLQAMDGITTRVGKKWGGRGKRAAMTAARKSARNEPDHRHPGGDSDRDDLLI